ncbi:unnamed protein product [Durusdinium trenchii]|uniref:Uncharacterized protein n=1 Tax=Durusdinium trenchii TaxID=1381693 RepID=A0ABP0MP79_9DINO
MGAICTVEHDQQVARGIAITPSLKMSEIKLTGEAYCACANDEWQDDVPGGQRASAEQVEEASFAMNLHAAKTEASGVTHPALLGRIKEDTVGTKLSIQSSEYMGPIETSSSSM